MIGGMREYVEGDVKRYVKECAIRVNESIYSQV